MKTYALAIVAVLAGVTALAMVNALIERLVCALPTVMP